MLFLKALIIESEILAILDGSIPKSRTVQQPSMLICQSTDFSIKKNPPIAQLALISRNHMDSSLDGFLP
jgi:hypothetical protein